MDDLFVNMALAVLFAAIKNPDKVRIMRRALIKLRDALVLALPD